MIKANFKNILNFLRPKEQCIKLPPDPFKQKYSDIKFIGKTKPAEKPHIPKPTASIISQCTRAKLMFININSNRSVAKRELTEMGIRNDDSDIVIIAETKADPDDPPFNMDGYYLVTEIARKSGAGGMLVLAKNTIDTVNPHSVSVVTEVQVVDFLLNDYLIIGVYRSPNAIGPQINQHRKLVNHLRKLLKKHTPGSPVILTGDFNLPILAACDFQPSMKPNDYVDTFADGHDEDKETILQLWSDLVQEFDLVQNVKSPSRATNNNILDLMFSYRSHDTPTHHVDPNLFHNEATDHFALKINIDTSYTTENMMRTRRLTSHKHLQAYRDRMKARQLYKYCPTDSTDNICHYLQSEIKFAFDKECPYVEVKKPPPWGYKSRELVRLMRHSNRGRYSLINKDLDEEQYDSIKQKLKKLNKYVKFMAKRDRTQNDIRKFETSAKKKKSFFSHVKNIKNKQTNKVGPVVDSHGVRRATKKEMTMAFGEKLGSELKPEFPLSELLYRQPTCKIFKELPECQLDEGDPHAEWFPDWFQKHPNSPEEGLTHQQIYMSPQFIVKQIKKAKRNSAAGPDEIPMLAFSVIGNIIAPILSILYNMVNQTGTIPKAFGDTKVGVLYKKKEKSDMNNYRPLSMTNHIGKLWERCINFHMMNHLEDNNLLCDNQEGFRRQRGTTTNLTKLWETVTAEVEDHRSLVELWNFDLTKAFDRLDHAKVLHLCHEAGIGGYLGVCLQNWLTTRTQFVQMDEHKSPETEVGKSCVQGSVLGPTLWTIYINTLLKRLNESNLNIKSFAYADDISIVRHIRTDVELNDFYDILGIIENWAKDYNMSWSAAKTQRVVFQHRGGRPPREPRFVFFNGKLILPMESKALKTRCESLGVIISKNLMFCDQIKRVENSMKAHILIMSRFFHNKTEALLISFYNAYMLPKLTYGCHVWSLGSEKYLRKLDEIVAKYWRMNKRRGPNGGPPPDFLKPSLLFVHLDQIQVHKIMMGNTSMDFDSLFTLTDSNTRQGSDMKIEIPKFSLKFNKHKFSVRAAGFFNALPAEYYDLVPTLFKKAAKLHILENKQKYSNMTRDYNVNGGEIPNHASAKLLKDRIKEMKRLSKEMRGGPIIPFKKNGSEKFWINTNYRYINGVILPKEPTILNVARAPLCLRRLQTSLL